MPATSGSVVLSDEVWNEVEYLVSPKVALISREMQPKVVSEKRRVARESRQTGNRGATVPMLLEMHERLTDEWISRTYQVYCETWARQETSKSAEFIRVVFHKAIVPLIAVRKAAILGDFDLMSANTRDHQFSAAKGKLTHSLKGLQRDWENKLEIEARECEYAKRLKVMESERPDLRNGNLSSEQGRGAKPKKNGTGRPKDFDVAKRREQIWSVIQRNGGAKKLKGPKYASAVDNAAIDTSYNWRREKCPKSERCPKSYKEAYKIPKWRKRIWDEKNSIVTEFEHGKNRETRS
jgi:hypothetical protein